MPETPVQDDQPDWPTQDECPCDFQPYDHEGEPLFEESIHYKRRCDTCREVFWSLHCRCEGPRTCGSCRQALNVKRQKRQQK